MKARVQTILHTVLLLTIAATAVQAQPREVTKIPWASQHFTTIGDLVFFTSRDALWRTDGTAGGTIFLRSDFDKFASFREFNGMLYFLSDVDDQPGWQELWRSDSVTGATAIRQWDKYPSQRSAAITLEQGKKYYAEALHKQGVGTDNIAVGWQLPDGTMERPIPGSRLSPFGTNTAAVASETQSTSSPDASMYSQISVYPNPAQSGAPELTLSGYEGIEETIETDVEIINMTGDVVFAERISCGGDCGTRLMKINEQLVPGVYLVNMKTNGIWISKRLLVK